ncbi:MAG TPA: BatD family protein [Kofleriaceae bacterium]|nr:BatD family protein [Kofleriaceae bacterium]
MRRLAVIAVVTVVWGLVAAHAEPAGPGSSAGSGSAGRVLRLPFDSAAPTVSAAASPTIVPLGGHFTLFVTVTFGPGVVVNLREPLGLGPAFEVRRQESEDRVAADGRTVREWQLDVMPWQVGDLELPPIAVTFTFAGQAAQIQSNAVPLKVVGALGEVADDPRTMRGLAAPAAIIVRDWLWIWVGAALAAAAAVVVIALWLAGRIRRRRRLYPVGYAGPRVPRADMTADRALAQLLAIQRAGVLDRDGERKLGYAQLVDVVRTYLGARFAIAVRDLTSSELLARLAAAAPSAELAQITAWLAGCDLVKYGAARASAAEAGAALDGARALIVATSQRRAAPEAA